MWHTVPWTFTLPCDLQDLILPPHEKKRLSWDMHITSEIKMKMDMTGQSNNQTSFTRTTFTDWYHNGMHALKRFLRKQPMPKKEEARQLTKPCTQCACWLSLNEGLMVKSDHYCLPLASPSLHWIVLYVHYRITYNFCFIVFSFASRRQCISWWSILEKKIITRCKLE